MSRIASGLQWYDEKCLQSSSIFFSRENDFFGENINNRSKDALKWAQWNISCGLRFQVQDYDREAKIKH